MDERLEGTALIVRAVDLLISEVEERDDPERCEDVRALCELRQSLLERTNPDG